jgi:hypothetical protein
MASWPRWSQLWVKRPMLEAFRVLEIYVWSSEKGCREAVGRWHKIFIVYMHEFWIGYITDGIVYIITTDYEMNHGLVICLHIASLILTLRADFGT